MTDTKRAKLKYDGGTVSISKEDAAEGSRKILSDALRGNLMNDTKRDELAEEYCYRYMNGTAGEFMAFKAGYDAAMAETRETAQEREAELLVYIEDLDRKVFDRTFDRDRWRQIAGKMAEAMEEIKSLPNSTMLVRHLHVLEEFDKMGET